MTSIDLLNVLGVVETNSVTYIQTLFKALEASQVVVPLRDEDDSQRIDALNIQEIITPVDGGGWLQPSLTLGNSEDIAHVSFTSGTEGTPKGVFLSRLALNNTVQRIQSVMQMDASVREYIGIPVYHSFGYGRCRHVAAVGGHFYIPESGFDPKEFARMLLADEVNALSLVPSLLRIFIENSTLLGEERFKLRWLEIGSQAMSKEEKVAVKRLFPNAVIVQHYGLTEASRTTLLCISEVDEAVLASVGRAYGDVELTINVAGRICIKGAHLASSILKDGCVEPLLENKICWFETSDLGCMDDSGYLYFQGRADNVVNCGGHKLSTETLELAVINSLKAHNSLNGEMVVSRIASALYGEAFLISYTSRADLEALKMAAPICLSDLGISAKSALCFCYIAALPKTATGKVQHKQLAQHYQKQNSVLSQSTLSNDDRFLQAVSQVLGLEVGELDLKYSVSDIGVDSLQSVRLSIHLEALLGYLPANWRVLAMGALLQLPREGKATSTALPQEKLSTQKAPPIWDGSSNQNPSDISFRALIKEDFITHERDLFSQGLFALFVQRFGNWRMGISSKYLRFPMTFVYRVLIKMAQVFCGIKLDYTVHVGRRVKLEHFGGMVLGARSIGDDTIIRQNTTLGIRDISDLSAKPIIEKGVNIGAGAVIVGNITIGRHSVIGPNCVVTEDLPPFSVVSVGSLVVTSPE